MAEKMPERIWDAASIEELSTRLRDRAEVARTEPTMTARCDAAHFIEAADAIEALFIRADLVDDLVKALEGAREDLAMAAIPAFKDPLYGDEVERLGERIGYGALMSSASASWRESAEREGYPAGGEFTVGPCVAIANRAVKIIDAALTRIKGDVT